MELNEESLMKCLIKLRTYTGEELLKRRKPTMLVVAQRFRTQAERIAFPWKGKRAFWLQHKR